MDFILHAGSQKIIQIQHRIGFKLFNVLYYVNQWYIFEL